MQMQSGVQWEENNMQKPWLNHYDPWFKEHLEYPNETLFGLIKKTAQRYPDYTALSFMGQKLTYSQMMMRIDQAAAGLQAIGFKAGSVATICLPNTPHAVIFFYAVNRAGGICNMVHPLTPAEEMAHYIRTTRSDYLIILDAMLPKHSEMLEQSRISKTIVCSITDYLSKVMSFGFYLTKGRKIPTVKAANKLMLWKDFLKTETADLPTPAVDALACAIYLHSGGTTGSPKTIMLSSFNFNALSVQGPQIIGLTAKPDYDPKGLSMVTILPLFHGFGLCMGMHTMLIMGLTSILVPQFSPDVLASIIVKEKPNYLAAVPTLFEGILKNPKLQNADLSCIRAAFCGGDTLTSDLKHRFDAFLKSHGSTCTLREGYGLTETVTVCAVNPFLDSREDTVGLPLSDVLMKVVSPGTLEEVAPGKDGEFCIHAPTVMMGYLDDEEATRETIRRHQDGLDWVHTGDYGFMDADGYFHFKQRIKRILKVSGIQVFPSQIEDSISQVPGVRMACVIGIPHPYKMQVAKAFVVKTNPAESDDVLKARILEHCERTMIQYAIPREIEFRDDLPKTKVGKIDFVALERIEQGKWENAEEETTETAG
jgi:long-chain acyl-CoA synthetase